MAFCLPDLLLTDIKLSQDHLEPDRNVWSDQLPDCRNRQQNRGNCDEIIQFGVILPSPSSSNVILEHPHFARLCVCVSDPTECPFSQHFCHQELQNRDISHQPDRICRENHNTNGDKCNNEILSTTRAVATSPPCLFQALRKDRKLGGPQICPHLAVPKLTFHCCRTSPKLGKASSDQRMRETSKQHQEKNHALMNPLLLRQQQVQLPPSMAKAAH